MHTLAQGTKFGCNDEMKCDIPPGLYVLAVSGGVDSMVLFDVVRRKPGVELIVAHVNHGIRADANLDAELVRKVSMSHNVRYEEVVLDLGPDASEEMARKARYEFLRHICSKYNAAAIITAHHRDDLLETAIINMVRGTGWRGLSSLRSTSQILRPFLAISKSELLEYATQHKLKWREDSTNRDTRYLRNSVRHGFLAKMSAHDREVLNQYIVRQHILRDQIDDEVNNWLAQFAAPESDGLVSLPRYQLIMLPQAVAGEILRAVLLRVVGDSVTRPVLVRALLFAKTATRGKVFRLSASWQLRMNANHVIVERYGA